MGGKFKVYNWSENARPLVYGLRENVDTVTRQFLFGHYDLSAEDGRMEARTDLNGCLIHLRNAMENLPMSDLNDEEREMLAFMI